MSVSINAGYSNIEYFNQCADSFMSLSIIGDEGRRRFVEEPKNGMEESSKSKRRNLQIRNKVASLRLR